MRALGRRRKRKGGWLKSHIANRYRRAGYQVKKHVITSKGEIDVLVKGRRNKIAIEVKSGKQTITSTTIRKIHEKAKQVRAKPLLVKGPNTTVTLPAKELAKELGVHIREWKPPNTRTKRPQRRQ